MSFVFGLLAVVMLLAFGTSFRHSMPVLYWITWLGVIALLLLHFVEDSEEKAIRLAKEESARRDDQEKKRRAEAEERQRELGELSHEKQKLTLQREIEEMKNPRLPRTAEETKFDDYQSKRTFDARQEIFEKVFLPAMTARELEKAFEKQKEEIDRDRNLSENQKD